MFYYTMDFFVIKLLQAKNRTFKGIFIEKKSVYKRFDKTGIVEFAQKLIKAEFEIVSTGGTFDLLTQNGINAVESADITGFRELIGGKVKIAAS